MQREESKTSVYLEVAIEAALEAGKILKASWGKELEIEEKAFSGDLVTQVDKQSEEAIIHKLQHHFPSHAILSEESGMHPAEEDQLLWMIDPLDGTTNYTHQHPMVSISIALVSQDSVIAAVVYNPIYQELFYASKGAGAFLNEKQMHVSDTEDISQSLLGTGFAYDRRQTPENNYAQFCLLTDRSQGVRRLGSAALDLAFVAAGRLDGFWERGLKPWDIAAGVLLVEEAGGTVSGYETSSVNLNAGRIIATNGKIHLSLKKLLTEGA